MNKKPAKKICKIKKQPIATEITSCFTEKDFIRETGFSSETIHLFSQWKTILEKWNQNINLVSTESIKEFWLRHVYDSIQIHKLIAPKAQIILDFGSGAGFPALALAILSRYNSKQHFILIDSRKKKIAFLKETITKLNLKKNIHPLAVRIENLGIKKNIPTENSSLKIQKTHLPYHLLNHNIYFSHPIDIITARACAPLHRLLEYAYPLWSETTQALFFKGQNIQKEIDIAYKYWEFEMESYPSLTCKMAFILKITKLQKRQNKTAPKHSQIV